MGSPPGKPRNVCCRIVLFKSRYEKPAMDATDYDYDYDDIQCFVRCLT